MILGIATRGSSSSLEEMGNAGQDYVVCWADRKLVDTCSFDVPALGLVHSSNEGKISRASLQDLFDAPCGLYKSFYRKLALLDLGVKFQAHHPPEQFFQIKCLTSERKRFFI